jgi:hypothetical protein
MAPVRELLVEARDHDELTVPDPTTTTLAMMGALSIVAMVRTANDTFDPDETAESLVPLFLNGLRPRQPAQTKPRRSRSAPR